MNARLVSCGTARFRRDAVVPALRRSYLCHFCDPVDSDRLTLAQQQQGIVESKFCVSLYLLVYIFGNYEYTFAFPHENPSCILLTP